MFGIIKKAFKWNNHKNMMTFNMFSIRYFWRHQSTGMFS